MVIDKNTDDKLSTEIHRRDKLIEVMISECEILKRELYNRDEILYKLKKYMGSDNFNLVVREVDKPDE